MTHEHERWMRLAIEEAEWARGATGDNPWVGCAIVSPQGELLGRGHTLGPGEDHAEIAAARHAQVRGQSVVGATLYSTLEPCAFHGRTPACAKSIADRGIARVVIGMRDPHPRVDGAGILMLRSAGVEVIEGVCEREVRRQLGPWVLDQHPHEPLRRAHTLPAPERLALLADIYGVDGDRIEAFLVGRTSAMSKVVAIMSMSLDGYVADLNDGVAEVFDWYMNSGDIAFHTGGSDPMTFKVSGPSAEHLRGLWSGLGAVLTGRRTFEVADGWNGNHAWGPAFVVTHHIPAGWPRPDSTVHFVTDGIESAVTRAKAAAGGKSVGVHGANTIQQCLNAGLLDEIHVDVAAVLLGSGLRLFDHLAGTPAVLGNPTVIAGVGVTHLRYPVRKA